MIDTLPGRRCASIRCFQHRLAGHPTSESGPIEFGWADGTWLTLDANADWTLALSTQPWVDPYAGVSVAEREALAQEVGLWHQAPAPIALRRLVGQSVASVLPEFNEVGELVGLKLAFEAQVVAARVVGGEVVVEALD
ncbi:hypothetical protein [Actinotalea sp. K2]|uniref:hypothetical protein n=1 Tax=Actinotalea sp. K2 TaxID=2939438 RepID=UPI0020179D90|nr:hypothetical protein [Actinotalea sp. K2]MCL3862103.1 hypothetical protein [Actinotalea sp. K2]